jgi:hypothetical protein
VAVGVAGGLGAVAGADLGEHVVDVAFYRCLADEQVLGDLGVGQAGRDQGEDLGLAGGEAVGEGRRRGMRLGGLAWLVGGAGPSAAGDGLGLAGGDRLDQGLLDGRVQGRLAARYALQGLADLVGAGVLGEVAERAGAEGVDDRAVVGVGGKDHHLDLGMGGPQAAGGLHPVYPGHPQVHQDHVRPELGGEGQRLLAVRGGADHLDVGQQAEQHGQAFADDALVIGGQHADLGPGHAGARSRTRKP